MCAIVGLGNPGEEYSGTRHNVGFAVVRELAHRWHLQWKDATGGVRTAQGCIAGRVVVLIEPLLYMNRSGDALALVSIEPDPENLIVVYDDVDLPLGRIRVRKGGGSAGHRGVESIVERFGSGFTRVRLGIGKPVHGMETAEHVLSRFEQQERDTATAAIREAADAVELVVENGTEAAMSKFNVRRPTELEPASSASATVNQKE